MKAGRTGILARLDETLRKVGAHSVLLSDTVARLVGLNSTDLECLDLVSLAGPTTAGRLAAHTGLTTGAMTAVIDRLEQAGFVRRRADPDDRRRVLVEAVPGGIRHIEPLYRRLGESMTRLNGEYDERQLALIAEYLTRAVDLVAEHVTWLQTQQPRPRRPARRVRQGRPVAPLARRTARDDQSRSGVSPRS
jgi:DNA-binding MarR family transcriptional regulator